VDPQLQMEGLQRKMPGVKNWIAGLFLILVVLGVSPGSTRQAPDPKLRTSDEEYEIYSSLIKQFYVKPEYHLMVIEDRTFRYDPRSEDDDQPWYDKPKKGVVIDPSTVEGYGINNTDHWVLDKKAFKLPVKCELVTSADLWAIFHGRKGQVEWLEFFKRYPDAPGFVMLSRVGFNTEHTQAMLYVGSQCGPGCWDLHFLLLEKTGGAWKIKKELRKAGSDF